MWNTTLKYKRHCSRPQNYVCVLGCLITFRFLHASYTCTKRNLLSNLARIFYPLGLLTPVTFIIKHLIQRIWSLKLAWDDIPPHDILRLWDNFVSDLPTLRTLTIPRLVVASIRYSCELHGFGDSSERGYCAVIYFVFRFHDRPSRTHFICSKSKVAPLKVMSIPRLELCAAVLVTCLLSYVRSVFLNRITFQRIYAWSDSTTVLAWIKSDANRWKTFVSHRVTYIQDHIASDLWLYIKSQSNPADIGSRGLSPKCLRVFVMVGGTRNIAYGYI